MATTKLVTTQPPQTMGVPMALLDTSLTNNQVGGSIDSVRQEVDDAFADMKTFFHNEPDQIMRIASGHSARLSELRVKIMRVEDYLREWKSIREREIEPCIAELERQWRNASRLQSCRELDWKMESGER